MMREGSGSRTDASISATRSKDSRFLAPSCSIKTSASCSPMRMEGFRDAIGSW